MIPFPVGDKLKKLAFELKRQSGYHDQKTVNPSGAICFILQSSFTRNRSFRALVAER